jgi:hypothetical protein
MLQSLFQAVIRQDETARPFNLAVSPLRHRARDTSEKHPLAVRRNEMNISAGRDFQQNTLQVKTGFILARCYAFHRSADFVGVKSQGCRNIAAIRHCVSPGV